MDPWWIEVFPDYGGAFPVWSSGEDDAHDYELSADLESALQAWAEEWERSPWSDYLDPRPLSPERPWFTDFQDWLERGRALTDRVQAEVGDAFNVLYRVSADEEDTWRA